MSNLNSKDWYTAEKMHESLKELANEKEISVEEIPEVKTIKGWIGRYSTFSKKEMSEKVLEENEENMHHEKINTKNITYNEPNKARKRQKRS